MLSSLISGSNLMPSSLITGSKLIVSSLMIGDEWWWTIMLGSGCWGKWRLTIGVSTLGAKFMIGELGLTLTSITGGCTIFWILIS